MYKRQALDQMGLKWVDIDGDLQDKLLKSVNYNAPQFNSQDIALTLSGLDGMGLVQTDLRDIIQCLTDTVTRLCPKFSFREIISCVEAFDHIGYYWQDFPNDFQLQFLTCIKESWPRLKSHESGMLMLRLSRLIIPREIL